MSRSPALRDPPMAKKKGTSVQIDDDVGEIGQARLGFDRQADVYPHQ